MCKCVNIEHPENAFFTFQNHFNLLSRVKLLQKKKKTFVIIVEEKLVVNSSEFETLRFIFILRLLLTSTCCG